LGRQEEALICFERALALDPHDARSLEHLGRCLGALGRHQEAIVSLDRALALDPYSVEVWSLKGSSLGELGRHVEAIACFDQSLARDPRHTMSLNNKGNSLAALGRLQEAALCFDQAVALTPKEAVVWHAKGAHLTALEDWDEALACCDRALELDPRYAAAWVNKGTCFCGLERWYEAISCFDRALELDPQLAAAWHNKGACLTAMHRRDEAISCLNQALELDPQIVQAWRKKGNNLIALNQWDEAIDCFERALELDPKEAAAWANKGFCLASSSRHEEAIACFDRAAALNPAKAKVFGFGKGASLAQLERWEEAITCYEYALALDPHMAEAWYNKARAEEKAGLPLDAARSYDRCVTAAPGTAAHIHHAYHRLGELLLGMENQAGSPALCEPGLSVPPIKSEQHRAAATRREYQKGDRIGQNYEVLDVLGHGGFGVVYLVRERRFLDARDLKTLFGDNPPPPHPSSLVYTDATYALKTFLSRYLTDSKVRDRFRREAQVLVDLEGHPYLLKAESVDEIAGRLYLVTEYVAPNAEGLNSLEGYLQRQPPDLAQSLQWAIQCCYGMEHAFSKGLRCHRDLKPANILITQDGVVKIADFGLAAALDQTRLADGVEVHMINGRPVSRWRSLLVYGKLCFHEPSQGHRRAANLRKGHPLAVNGDTIYRQAQYRLLARKTCLLRVPVEKEHRWKRARKPD
jgi:tetratricopeptide (TPR) repeat protein/tRNA A-37 threonylcarbamoyl transferase component Bud32